MCPKCPGVGWVIKCWDGVGFGGSCRGKKGWGGSRGWVGVGDVNLIVYRKGDIVKQLMKSRDVLPKNVPGVGWGVSW